MALPKYRSTVPATKNNKNEEFYPQLYIMTETVQIRPARLANIYAIFSVANNQVYYGATCKQLSERFRQHKGSRNTTRSKDIMTQQDAKIELVESIEATKKELAAKEGEAIKRHHNSKWATFKCVNHVIPGRTAKEYRTEHKDNINGYLSTVVNCEACGCVSSVRNIARHNKSKRHLLNVEFQ